MKAGLLCEPIFPPDRGDIIGHTWRADGTTIFQVKAGVVFVCVRDVLFVPVVNLEECSVFYPVYFCHKIAELIRNIMGADNTYSETDIFTEFLGQVIHPPLRTWQDSHSAAFTR